MKRVIPLLFVALLSVPAGCALHSAPVAQMRTSAMAIPPEDASRYDGKTSLREAISVGAVTGSKEVTSVPMNLTGLQVRKSTLDEFREALIASLQTAKLLRAAGAPATYQLHAELQRAEMGALMNRGDLPHVQVRYRLVRISDNAEVFNTAITTSEAPQRSDSPNFARSPLHAPLRKNIFQLIERLYGTDIRSP